MMGAERRSMVMTEEEKKLTISWSWTCDSNTNEKAAYLFIKPL